VPRVDSAVDVFDAAGMEVVARPLRLPASYGRPDRVLSWEEVERKLAESPTYWLATTRRDGRPHAVPVDGIWLAGALYFGGDPATVHIRNLGDDPRAVVHTESGGSPVIAEGVAEWHQPTEDEITGLVAATRTKYGYPASPDSYRSGIWRLAPVRVLAWNVLYEDATRFTFD
jgi:pyridoxamine 5'-phosphate oxidase-like protein